MTTTLNGHRPDLTTPTSSGGGMPWEVPVPLTHTTPPPPFPVDALPGWLTDMVTATARFTQTDPAMAGTVALAVLSACAGGRLEVEARPGWREPVNLFVAVVADPGERKSPVHGLLTRPLLDAERTLADRTEPLIAEQAALKDIAARTAEQAKATAARADAARRDELTAEAIAAALAAETVTVPGLPRLFADDATPEALTSLMASNGGRMAVISDEGGIFDTLAGRYSSTPNLDPYLKGHSGTLPLRVDRKGREPEYVPKPSLTVGVMIQPRVLRKFGADADMVGRGLVARFLFALPTSLAGWREVDPDPVPAEVADTYAGHIHDLAAALAEWTDPAVVTLTDQAAELRSHTAAAVEEQLRPGGALHDMREWSNKLGGATIRLAGLLHTAHHPTDAWRKPVDAATMTGAVKLAEFFTAHYRTATSTIAADPATTAARHALHVLIANDMSNFTRRELHRKVIRRLPKAADVTAALDTLTYLGWVRAGDGGRYELHPRAADLADHAETTTTAVNQAFGTIPGGHR
ncbi:DUF3987 domain-containing protein [Natronosporangium hydrolyticum]|uniref:DUF3987 domain-containing protein n=1 Tax=Natronosporangium hydrolyticum TaxID=2811111 RepID=A0A895YK03_9ACTN|nr:YfjI family protein [Natronosporangium hydrolyticum]QSB14138.1 DUF3987 domain-containing protein [Natronosporangium hydrolyticum]